MAPPPVARCRDSATLPQTMWVPKHILCVLGNWQNADAVLRIVGEVTRGTFIVDEEYSQYSADARMPQAFDACRDRAHPTFSPHDVAAVAAHSAVIYIMSPHVLAQDALRVSATALRLVGALLRAGALAVKSESAGIAHGMVGWARLAEALDNPASHAGLVLRDAFVRRPLLDGDDDCYYTCGMHLLGYRDIEMPADLSPEEAIRWFDGATAALIDQPEDSRLDKPLELDGTYRMFEDGGPCTRYEQDSFFYNPYGYWHLTEAEPLDGSDHEN